MRLKSDYPTSKIKKNRKKIKRKDPKHCVDYMLSLNLMFMIGTPFQSSNFYFL